VAIKTPTLFFFIFYDVNKVVATESDDNNKLTGLRTEAESKVIPQALG
jgi:hypothetical protein